MKIIFLDINGVLDTNERMDEIDSNNLKRLEHIVNETGAKVVISSSLKNSYYHFGYLSEKLNNIIKQIESKNIEVIGITPKSNIREEEIQLYLQSHPEIENFCIIDDDYEMESLKENLVKLPNQMQKDQKGLDDIHTKIAIEILNNPTKKLYKK